MTALTSPQRVAEVLANPDPVARNLQITQSYHELTVALDALFGGLDVNWCAFATWASKEAGRFIRHEELPAALRRYLGLEIRRFFAFALGAEARGLTDHALIRREQLESYVRSTVEDVSAHVAEGNRLVYARLAPLFAGFLALARELAAPDPERLEAFLAEHAADPTTGEDLRRAFRQYHAALFEADPDPRAQRLFLANALVGWHEQIRLQEAIEGALEAPIRRALEDPGRYLEDLPWPRPLVRLAAFFGRWLLLPAIRGFEDDWRRVATRLMMTLATPEGRLDLSDDVPPLEDGSMYPSPLVHTTLPELDDVLGELDLTPGTTRGSAARDWTSLTDRMNYIVDFFRSRQRQRALLTPPFTPEQVAAIHRGAVPPGPL